MEGYFKKQDGQSDKDVLITRLLENYDGSIHVASMSKDLASWYDNEWGKFVYVVNVGVKHVGIKNEIYLTNINSFHEQVLHEHEMSNNDISLEYIKNEIKKQKHTIKQITDSIQNFDSGHKYENEIDYGILIEKMKGVLPEKEEKEFYIIEQHKRIEKIFDECDCLINEYFNSELTRVGKVCQLNMKYNMNSIMYDNCLRDIKSIDINSDKSIIVKGYEKTNTNNEKSSLDFQKQQQHDNNNNDTITIVQENAYDGGEIQVTHLKMFSVDCRTEIIDSPIHKVDDIQNILYAFSLVIMENVDNCALIISVKIDVQGWYDECIIYDDCG